MPSSAPAIDIGIQPDARADITEGLSRVLADNYSLYFMTHAFHWNVTGPMFRTLHQMFEDQYRELWGATDLIAERIRALGAYAPGSYGQLARYGSIKAPDEVPAALDMVRLLVEGHEAVAKQIRTVFPIAEKADDQATMDLLVDRLRSHEKTAWMLRSLLE
ncbi:MAG TPA: Dps family protein [Kofleriaceae bacterium]|nr:Dps family protein [Kofleriaceae bacterium]